MFYCKHKMFLPFRGKRVGKEEKRTLKKKHKRPFSSISHVMAWFLNDISGDQRTDASYDKK